MDQNDIPALVQIYHILVSTFHIGNLIQIDHSGILVYLTDMGVNSMDGFKCHTGNGEPNIHQWAEYIIDLVEEQE